MSIPVLISVEDVIRIIHILMFQEEQMKRQKLEEQRKAVEEQMDKMQEELKHATDHSDTQFQMFVVKGVKKFRSFWVIVDVHMWMIR